MNLQLYGTLLVTTLLVLISEVYIAYQGYSMSCAFSDTLSLDYMTDLCYHYPNAETVAGVESKYNSMC